MRQWNWNPTNDGDGYRVSASAGCLADLEARARSVLSPEVWDFIAGGAGDESAMRANRAALDAIRLVPRVLTGASPAVSTGGLLLRSEVAMPVAVAPIAYHQLVHPDGELATAAAARDLGVPFVVSTMSSCAVEEIAAVGAEIWFQLYWLDDDRRVRQLLDRAGNAGCSAVLLTADMPVMARRPRDIRNNFTLPAGIRAVHLSDATDDLAHTPGDGSAVAAHTASAFKDGLSWQHVRLLREWTDLPIVVKGILHPEDAIRAVDSGSDAVVVSNHGGRQFDAAPGAAAQLSAVVEAVDGDCSVLFDSGIRSGTDVLRALALGAAGVLIGRPIMWGLALAGQEGAKQALSLLQAELADALTLAGCVSLDGVRSLTVGE